MLELRFRLRQGTLTAQLAHSTCTTALLSVERSKFLHAFCSLLALQLSLRMADQEKFEYLVSLASRWAKDQEELILRRGIPLAPRYLADANRVGVQKASRVKVLIVDLIPMPANAELAEAARSRHIISDASRGVTVGHGIIIRADSWGNRELMVHQLVHVAQCERSGARSIRSALSLRSAELRRVHAGRIRSGSTPKGA